MCELFMCYNNLCLCVSNVTDEAGAGSTTVGTPLENRRSPVELFPLCKVHTLHLLRGQGPHASGSSSLSVAAWCPMDGRATVTARP